MDEQTIGAVAGYLIRFTVGELPAWVVTLAEHFMSWTYDANGPHGENDGDRDNRPLTWNSQFFDFLGILVRCASPRSGLCEVPRANHAIQG